MFAAVLLLVGLLGASSAQAMNCWVGNTSNPDFGHTTPVLTPGFGSCLAGQADAYYGSLTIHVSAYSGILGSTSCPTATAASMASARSMAASRGATIALITSYCCNNGDGCNNPANPILSSPPPMAKSPSPPPPVKSPPPPPPLKKPPPPPKKTGRKMARMLKNL